MIFPFGKEGEADLTMLTEHVAKGADVWYRYPTGPGDHAAPGTLPFEQLTNVLMTPHSSGITTDTFTGRADDIAANVGGLARAEPLHDVGHGLALRHGAHRRRFHGNGP